MKSVRTPRFTAHQIRGLATRVSAVLLACGGTLLLPATAVGQDAAANLAKQLANPIASLISVPLQYNSDSGYGPTGDGDVERLNIQPVIPISLDKDWNLITRTIIPVVAQNDIPTRGEGDSGLGDVVASQFFSPKEPTSGGWIWLVAGGGSGTGIAIDNKMNAKWRLSRIVSTLTPIDGPPPPVGNEVSPLRLGNQRYMVASYCQLLSGASACAPKKRV